MVHRKERQALRKSVESQFTQICATYHVVDNTFAADLCLACEEDPDCFHAVGLQATPY